ncbi:MAG: ribonuclease HIII [Candidatus Rhabdochlamydia sp.]
MTFQKRSCFVTIMDLKLKNQLHKDLIDQGFTLTTPAYTFFSAKKKGISCTLYTSGKLMVQGKEMDEFIRFYLEPQILQALTYSNPEPIDTSEHIGVDEAGKGDFFGPLCVAAVYADEEKIKALVSLGVRDSKTISDPAVIALASKIKVICPHALVILKPKTYNQLYARFQNLNRLLAWGHATAIAELVQKTHCRKVIIDQFANETVVLDALKQKKLDLELTQRHRAESDLVVAASSILARAAFLQGLDNLSQLYKIQLPKGASKEVIRIGKAFCTKHSSSLLEEVAKLHFKTLQEII